MSHVPFVTGILLLFVKQKSVEDFVRLIKLLYGIGPGINTL